MSDEIVFIYITDARRASGGDTEITGLTISDVRGLIPLVRRRRVAEVTRRRRQIAERKKQGTSLKGRDVARYKIERLMELEEKLSDALALVPDGDDPDGAA